MKILRTDNISYEKLAEIFSDSYKKQRKIIPELNQKFENINVVAPRIERAFSKGMGVVAMENEDIVGYIAGFSIDNFKSSYKGIYIPEWGHGSIEKDKINIYAEMYEEASKLWMENKIIVHAFAILAYDSELKNYFHRMAFGCHAEDGVRVPESVNNDTNNNIVVKPLDKSMIPDIIQMDREHVDYMTLPPVFFPKAEEYTDFNFYEQWLQKDDRVLYLAYSDGKPAGYIQGVKANTNASPLANDETTFAINGAFVRPEFRRNKISTILLNTLLNYVKNNNYERCTVDYETYNPSGSAFWQKYFKPYSTSFIRYIDNRTLKLK